MGRTITEPQQEFSADISAENRPAGFMGIFGSGMYRPFYDDATFIVPDGVEQIRVRVVGPGGGPDTTGGGGGGYAHGVFDVSPGASFPVTVPGETSPANNGGTTSFGALISATGGNSDGTGGIGTGGDFQANGGTATGHGGAGAGSQLGDGGNSSGDGGAGVINDAPSGSESGSSAFSGSGVRRAIMNPGSPGTPVIVQTGLNIIGTILSDESESEAPYNANATKSVIRFPFDGFTGSGASRSGPDSVAGSGGGGGIASNGAEQPLTTGGDGGGGGYGNGVDGGVGGIGAGGGNSTLTAGNGGQGLVVVEW